MSNGIYGTIKPASIDPAKDVEILYHYRPTRGSTDVTFDSYKQLDASTCLVSATMNSGNSIIKGLFDLRLPLSNFNKKGFYTVYLRPKERSTSIVDVSVLSSYPTVKGVVFKIGAGSDLDGIDDLTGYRIDYSNGESRLIKSCTFCIEFGLLFVKIIFCKLSL